MKAYKVNDNRLNLFFEKITGSRKGERNLFVRDKVVSSNNYNFNNWEYQMELWCKSEDEELNRQIPNRLLVLWFYDRNDNSKKIEVARLMEFAVLTEDDVKDKYAVKLSLWKRGLSM